MYAIVTGKHKWIKVNQILSVLCFPLTSAPSPPYLLPIVPSPCWNDCIPSACMGEIHCETCQTEDCS